MVGVDVVRGGGRTGNAVEVGAVDGRQECAAQVDIVGRRCCGSCPVGTRHNGVVLVGIEGGGRGSSTADCLGDRLRDAVVCCVVGVGGSCNTIHQLREAVAVVPGVGGGGCGEQVAVIVVGIGA